MVLGCHKIINVHFSQFNIHTVLGQDYFFFFLLLWSLVLLMDKTMEGNVCNATPRKDGDNEVYKLFYQEVTLCKAICHTVSLKQSTPSPVSIVVSSLPTIPTFILIIGNSLLPRSRTGRKDNDCRLTKRRWCHSGGEKQMKGKREIVRWETNVKERVYS